MNSTNFLIFYKPLSSLKGFLKNSYRMSSCKKKWIIKSLRALRVTYNTFSGMTDSRM